MAILVEAFWGKTQRGGFRFETQIETLDYFDKFDGKQTEKPVEVCAPCVSERIFEMM